MSLFINYKNDDFGANLIIEDDDKNCYAYLLIDGEVVSDVWLYNVGKAPSFPEWNDSDKLPFSNPVGLASEENFQPIKFESDINLFWVINSDDSWKVRIFLKGVEHALLYPGAKPGWCRLAMKSGPIARALNEIN